MSAVEPSPAEPVDGSGQPLRDGPLPATTRIVKNGGSGVSMLGAAMLAVGEILEPEKTHAEIEMVQPGDDHGDDRGLDLSFGDLPSLDD